MATDREWYPMPMGPDTKNVEEYIDAWHSFAETVAHGIGPGWKCYAFDPGISLLSPNGNRVVDVPMVLAHAIYRLVNRVTALEAQRWES